MRPHVSRRAAGPGFFRTARRRTERWRRRGLVARRVTADGGRTWTSLATPPAPVLALAFGPHPDTVGVLRALAILIVYAPPQFLRRLLGHEEREGRHT